MFCSRWIINGMLLSWLVLLPVFSYGQTMEEEIKILKDRIELLEKKMAEKELEQPLPMEPALEERIFSLEREVDRLGYSAELLETLSSIEAGGDLTLIMQQAERNKRGKDKGDLSTSADLELRLPVGPFGILFTRANVGQGEGVAKWLPNNFSGPNADLEFDDSRFQWVEAWFGTTFPWPSIKDQRFSTNVGKMDPTAFFDTNRLANAETDQFIADLFVNNLGIDWGGDDNGYGFGSRLAHRFTSINQKGLTVEGSLGYFDGDGDFSDTFRDPFLIAELSVNRSYNGLEGNYHFYAWQNDQNHTEWKNYNGNGKRNRGFGFSIDQDISSNLAFFTRYGYQDPDVSKFDQVITMGGRIVGNHWRRARDHLGVAYGMSHISKDYKKHSLEIDGYKADENEHYFEFYYRYNIWGDVAVTPDIQYVINPGGGEDGDGPWIFGLRLQVNF